MQASRAGFFLEDLEVGQNAELTRRVEETDIAAFAAVSGDINPLHLDENVAHAAGYSHCPVPPTFLKALESEHFSSAQLLSVLKVSVGKVLHVEQSFDYVRPVCVGEAVEISRTITDLYDKREGAMSFIVVRTDYRVDEQVVGSSVQTIMIRNETVVT